MLRASMPPVRYWKFNPLAAQSADQTVLVMGLDLSQEAEGLDRTSLAFPGLQAKLIDLVIGCSARPVVLVVMSGGQVDLGPYVDEPGVGAILWVGYPGQSGGTAIADTVFGSNA